MESRWLTTSGNAAKCGPGLWATTARSIAGTTASGRSTATAPIFGKTMPADVTLQSQKRRLREQRERMRDWREAQERMSDELGRAFAEALGHEPSLSAVPKLH